MNPSRPDRPWVPALTGADAADALEVVRRIADDLATLAIPAAGAVEAEAGFDPRALDGGPELAHRARFFAACADALGDSGYRARADALLEAAVDRAHEVGLPPALHGGLLAVAQILDQLRLEDDDPCAEIEAALLDELDARSWMGGFDLISGLVGIGVYALGRDGRGGSTELAGRILAVLEHQARPERGGLAWHTPVALLPGWQRPGAPDGHFDLGVAHGVPGVLGLAARACARSVDRQRAERLVRGALAWLDAVAIHGADASFATRVLPTATEPLVPARSAWCYGDPGISVQLWAAGDALDDQRWRDAGLALAHATLRRHPAAVAIDEASLCHGAVGLAHIFNRLAQASGDRVLADAAVAWYGRALQLRVPGEGVAGFRSCTLDPTTRDRSWHTDRSFLSGVVGIGLALLAGATERAPSWDAVLLLDL